MIASLFFILGASSCGNQVEESDEPPLAEVFDSKLYPSDIMNESKTQFSGVDSASFVQAYVDQWVRGKLVEELAEKEIASDQMVEKLVADFKASLMRHKYEQAYVEQNMNKVVTQTETIKYYEANFEKHILKSDIYLCNLMTVKIPEVEKTQLRLMWKELEQDEVTDELNQYAKNHAVQSRLGSNIWLTEEEISSVFGSSFIENNPLTKGKEYVEQNGGLRCLIKIYEKHGKNKPAPMSYLKPEIVQIILKQRKEDVLKNMIDELFNKELEQKNIKIHI